MDAHERQQNFTACGVVDLYDRLEAILKRRRPDRLAAFWEFLEHEEETSDTDRPAPRSGRR